MFLNKYLKYLKYFLILYFLNIKMMLKINLILTFVNIIGAIVFT